MSTNEKLHLDYLQGVADQDVKVLYEKEKTYGGSWKKRGGVGAFMMLARKWDRLEVMSSQRGYDVFRDVGDGSDGSLIEQVRDLRRYLLLVEAELIVRGEISGAVRVRSYNIGTPEDGGHHATEEEQDTENLQYEVNHYELRQLPQWKRDLYFWNAEQDKYVLKTLSSEK